MKGPETHRTTYVTVPVRIRHCSESLGIEVLGIDWSDSGEPGVWGDTWIDDEDLTGDGAWVFDSCSQVAGWEHIRDLLTRVPF